MMGSCAVVWLGVPRPPDRWTRRLAAAGLPLVEIIDRDHLSALTRTLSPCVVLLAPGNDAKTLGPLLGQTRPRVIGVVERRELGLDLLGKGVVDIIPIDARDDEVGARVSAWAQVAERERAEATDQVLGERVRELEERLHAAEAERDRLRELAHKDELTGLGNRRSFHTHLEFALGWASRYGGAVSAVIGDLDGMKPLNDRFGHPAGDAALRLVGKLLRQTLRSVDHAARLGGDEFGLIMPHTGAEDAARVAERIRRQITELVLPARLRLSVSFGVASLVAPRGVGFAGDELVARADAALYEAKRAGKNRVEIDKGSRKAA
jgi:diguanylate cyclase (GGDEF)-like protein